MFIGLFMRNRGVWMQLGRQIFLAGADGAKKTHTVPKVSRREMAAMGRKSTASIIRWVKQQRLFGLHHQVRDLCLADVDDFVPRDAVAEEGRPCFQRHLTRTARISDAHGATR